jgi:hypothetical protein
MEGDVQVIIGTGKQIYKTVREGRLRDWDRTPPTVRTLAQGLQFNVANVLATEPERKELLLSYLDVLIDYCISMKKRIESGEAR